MKTTPTAFLFILSVILAGAASPQKAQGEQKTWTVSQDYWVAYMAKVLPPELCKDGSYFRECFKITKEECDTEAKKATDTCLNDQKKDYPATFQQPVDGKNYGRKLGECTGLKFELALATKRIQSDKCHDPSQRVGK